MKPLGIIILGCLPLAALTLWSFVELRGIEDHPPPAGQDAGKEAELAEQARKLSAAEKAAADRLAAADFLAGEALPSLKMPADSEFRAAGETWSRWTAAREMVDAYCEVQRLTDTTDANRLGEAVRQFEKVKDKYKTSMVGATPECLRSREQYLKLIDGRIAELNQLIERGGRMTEANQRLTRAREKFKPGSYAACIELCDELTSKYAGVLSAADLEKVRLLKARAQFWDDAQRLSVAMKSADTLASQRPLLQEFLGKYADRTGRTPSERTTLEQFDRQLADLEAKLGDAEKNQAAKRQIDEFNGSLPASFADRLHGAARIVANYPTDAVHGLMRANFDRWLREALPAKPVAESALVQETQTGDGQIVRGFFKEVKDADGKLVGYKRYATYQEYLDPVSQVGTYKKEDLARPPAPTVARRITAEYHESRQRVLEQPGRRQSWTALAELCETLEGQWRQYKKRPGASREELSFAQEARFARELLAGDLWQDVTTIVGP
jgi:hypothetical protein